MQAVLVNLIQTYGYFLMVPLTLVEGPIVMMLTGFLLHLGYFSFIPAYFCLMAGDLLGDIWWYCVGYFFGIPFVQKFGRFFSIDEKSIHIVERFFHKHDTKILVISKLTTGFGFALVTLVTAGLVKIPFKKYFLLNFLGEFIWTGLLMGIGYLFGNFYVTVNNVLGRAFTASLFVIAFIALIGFGKYVRMRVTQANA